MKFGRIFGFNWNKSESCFMDCFIDCQVTLLIQKFWSCERKSRPRCSLQTFAFSSSLFWLENGWEKLKRGAKWEAFLLKVRSQRLEALSAIVWKAAFRMLMKLRLKNSTDIELLPESLPLDSH